MKPRSLAFWIIALLCAAACNKKDSGHPATTITPPKDSVSIVKTDSPKVTTGPVNHRHTPTGRTTYPYTDTFFGTWHDVASGDLPNGDTTFNTYLYVAHVASDSVSVTGDIAFVARNGTTFSSAPKFPAFHFKYSFHTTAATVYHFRVTNDIRDTYTFAGDSLSFDRNSTICLFWENGDFSGSSVW